MNTVAAKKESEVRFGCGTKGTTPSLTDIAFERGLGRMAGSKKYKCRGRLATVGKIRHTRCRGRNACVKLRDSLGEYWNM